MTSSVEIKVDDVWSVQLRRIVSTSGWGVLESQRRPVVAPRSYRYILRKRGRDYRSYETVRELIEGTRFIAGKDWDEVRLRLAEVIRSEQPEGTYEHEKGGISHWL